MFPEDQDQKSHIMIEENQTLEANEEFKETLQT